VVGIVMMPWKLLADPSGYIFTWLLGYSALLGPIGGVLIADYFVYRRRNLNLAALYQSDGEYRFTGGWSIAGLGALGIAILPSLPGFLATINVVKKENVAPIFMSIYSYAWFVGFGVAFVAYLAARKLAPAPASVPARNPGVS
jgi:NCS1 family nucleobase:cation symporter-1